MHGGPSLLFGWCQKLGSLLLTLGGLGAVTLFIMTSDVPLSFAAPQVSADEKARLVKVIKSSQFVGENTKQLSISDSDANLILATGFERFPISGKAEVEFGDRTVRFDFSLKNPLGPPFGRHVNCKSDLRMEVEGGELRLDLERLRIGYMDFSGVLLRLLEQAAVSAIRSDASAKEVIASIDRISFTPRQAQVVYRSERFPEELRTTFHAHFGEAGEVVRANRGSSQASFGLGRRSAQRRSAVCCFSPNGFRICS